MDAFEKMSSLVAEESIKDLRERWNNRFTAGSYVKEMDKNHVQKERIDLKTLHMVEITPDNYKEVKRQYPALKHVGVYKKNLNGSKIVQLEWLTPDEKVRVASALLYLNYKHAMLKANVNLIDDIQVSRQFQSHGLTKQILDVCTKKYQCNCLETFSGGDVAIHTYQSYGFKKVATDPESGVSIWTYGSVKSTNQ